MSAPQACPSPINTQAPHQRNNWDAPGDFDMRNPLRGTPTTDKVRSASKVGFSWFSFAGFGSFTFLAMYFSDYKISVTILLSGGIGVLAGLSCNGDFSDPEQVKRMVEIIKLIILAIAKAL